MTIDSGIQPEDVFIVVAFASENSDVAEISIVASIMEVNNKLEELTYGNIQEELIKVYSGVIMSCLHLPKSFHGIIPHILVVEKPKFSELMDNLSDIYDDDYMSLGYDYLYGDIEDAKFISGPPDQQYMAEKIEKLVTEDNIKIDDILLFFGHELIPVLQVSADSYDDDEEIVTRLSDIKNDICML